MATTEKLPLVWRHLDDGNNFLLLPCSQSLAQHETENKAQTEFFNPLTCLFQLVNTVPGGVAFQFNTKQVRMAVSNKKSRCSQESNPRPLHHEEF